MSNYNNPLPYIIPRVQYVATPGQTVFGFNFGIFAATNLRVYSRLADTLPDDATQLLALGTDYNVTFTPDSPSTGGFITITPSAADGQIITIIRLSDPERNSYFIPGRLSTDDLNNDADNELFYSQNIYGNTNASYPSYNLSATTTLADLILPQLGANQAWAMNADGTGIVPVTTDGGGGGGLPNPMTTEGDMIVGGPVGIAQRLAVGAEGTVLGSNGTVPLWFNPSTLYLQLSGGTMTGPLILAGDPSTALEATTKQYVDSISSGLQIHDPCVAASIATLDATYNNGTDGVGATLEMNVNGAPVLDGVTLEIDERAFIFTQADPAENGIYTVTTVGDVDNPSIYTRATDFDTAGTDNQTISPGSYTLIQQGQTLAGASYTLTALPPYTVGTTDLVFSQFSSPTPMSPPRTLITSVTLSATASPLAFTSADIGNYNTITFTFDAVHFSAQTQMRLGGSIDGGSTYPVVGSCYTLAGGTPPISAQSSAAPVRLDGGAGLNSANTYSGSIIIANPTFPGIKQFSGVLINAASGISSSFSFQGFFSPSTKLSAFSFTLSAGNFLSGTIIMYGS